jgi:hypothetical protein
MAYKFKVGDMVIIKQIIGDCSDSYYDDVHRAYENSVPLKITEIDIGAEKYRYKLEGIDTHFRAAELEIAQINWKKEMEGVM